ncbi:MAG: hypothetical protein LBQ10_10070 [Desulfovibrio sp.]|jgi:predicted MFS family arabinose efflux permease|nr:hypothetical protein [Desulfovibrio sp.]
MPQNPFPAAQAASGHTQRRRAVWLVTALAFLVIMTSMGTRLTIGLFVQPLMDDKGLSIAATSMALAIGQLSWGLFQPIFGAWADKGHPFAALATRMLCIAAGQLLTIMADGFWLLTLA